ncbi:hypothetical protein OTB20_17290 [Streptomyces sp. H27-H1]|uniref:hypothetical protein n=1 Tax=Streptomyces sp. H27-H1 TaxID=2996461 RepID=UPI00227035C5|nr:hypothetical protein [Streptomyces sp. H27-H1]MCY0927932.1 hypothetical protein [Streptomyces sp. H27-H1]
MNSPKGRLSLEQRRRLAETLTDAVLVPEVGQFAPAARSDSRCTSPSASPT